MQTIDEVYNTFLDKTVTIKRTGDIAVDFYANQSGKVVKIERVCMTTSWEMETKYIFLLYVKMPDGNTISLNTFEVSL